MMEDNSLSRRRVLAAVSAVTSSTIVSTTGTAQERDPDEFDRPRTVIDNGIEFIQWDCSRAIIDTNDIEVASIAVHTHHLGYEADYYDEPSELDGTIEIIDFTLPIDVRVTDHYPDFEPEEGSIIISGVEVFDRANQRLANVGWPINEWRCREVRDSDLDLTAIRGLDEIEYEYEVISR
ncbi:hypothetical protein [Natronolimnobius baerhuensis]|uniref:hypothetical protein n=1 Tax=Natronolimnobius baerhuensis TaxID=253108 RepID=UPI001124D518|nr:hypothetical protein [Natronolimnobius baerhuensis]